MTPQSNVFNMDCLVGMRDYPDGFFDLAVCDPPYGIGVGEMNLGKGGGVAKHGDYDKKSWDNQAPTGNYFSELKRVSRNQIIWGGNYFPELPATKGWIVWKKMDIKNSFSPIEMAWTSDLKMGFLDFLWCGMWQENMRNKETRIHPTQKPIALYQWILKNYAKPGDKILDTHMGSQSSRIACYKMGFDYWGYEIDREYFESGCKRFALSIAEPLFDQPKTEQGKLL